MFEDIDNGDTFIGVELCLSCENYDGGHCAEYRGMPKEFFGRRNKCKHYIGIWGDRNEP